jgi:hypothetical protein
MTYNEIIIEKLKKLAIGWDKSAESKERTAYTLYSRESMEYKALQLASNAQINCILDINSFIEELKQEEKKEEENEIICKCDAEIKQDKILLNKFTTTYGTDMVFIYAKCDKCNIEYNTGLKFLPEEYVDIITEAIKIKKALQEEIIRIIDKEEEGKIKECIKFCNDIDEALGIRVKR